MALNKWPHYSCEDNYKGLRWCRLHRINLQGFTLEKVVARGVPQLRELSFQPSVRLAVVISLSSV